jgi:anti-sigma regulatory factor (Ser/Thr protein kinase)
VTNGLTHGGASAVDVCASIGPDRIELIVDHVESAMGPRRPTAVVTPIDQGGRGLRIVGALSADMTAERCGDHRSTSVVIERRQHA